MIHLTPFRQRQSHCGPASLKMVLGFYGIPSNERALARVAGTMLSTGTTADGLLRAAKMYGCDGRVFNDATIGFLRRMVLVRKIPVIVQWFSTDEGHYSVVVHLDRDNIYLQDPEAGHLVAMKLATFKRVWFDFVGSKPPSTDTLIARRVIVVDRPAKVRG